MVYRKVVLPLLAGVLTLAVGLEPAVVLGDAGKARDEMAEDTAAGTHEPLVLREGRLWRTPVTEGNAIAEVTAYCGTCHEDTADAMEGDVAGHPGDSAARNHPVDVAYPEDDPDYRAPADLEPALLLLDGRLSCVSCHAHDDPGHSLALPAEGSEICRACHLI